jgi:hypothetical protein
MTEIAVVRRVWHRPLRWSAAGLCLVGAGLAGLAAVRSFVRVGGGRGAVFVLAAAMLVGVAVAIVRGVRWLLVVMTVALAGQVLAVAGTIIELAVGVDEGKAGELHQLGFDPTIGVVINLAYSAAGVALLGWCLVRWWRIRRS